MTCSRCHKDVRLPKNPVGREPIYCAECRLERARERRRACEKRIDGRAPATLKPGNFALVIQWKHGGPVEFIECRSIHEATDGWHGFMSCENRPSRLEIVVVQRKPVLGKASYGEELSPGGRLARTRPVAQRGRAAVSRGGSC